MSLISHPFTDNGESSVVRYGGAGNGDGRLTLGAEEGGATYSGTLTVHHREDSTTGGWMDLEVDMDVSSVKSKQFFAPPGDLKIVLSGGTSPNFTAKIVPH